MLAGTVLFAAASGVLAGALQDVLIAGGFEVPGSESARAFALLRDQFETREPNVAVLVTARGGDVDDPDVAQVGRRITERLRDEPSVQDAESYWTLGNAPPLRSGAGNRALILVTMLGSDHEVGKVLDALTPKYATLDDDLVTVDVNGSNELLRQFERQAERDLLRVEAIAIPLTLLVLLVVFRSVVAALLPLVVAGVAIIGTLAALWVLSHVTDFSVFALNLTTTLGLALAIDYALLLVSRFREELAGGHDVDAAIVRTFRTAGRTVAFSAVTVAIGMSVLFVFPLMFLRSIAVAGITVSILSASVALLTLPALLSVVGTRIDRLQIWRRGGAERVGWRRMSEFVMRRAPMVAVGVVAALLVVGAPFLSLDLGGTDPRVLDPANETRQIYEVIVDEFDTREAFTTAAVAPDVDPVRDAAALDSYALALSRVEGVARVDGARASYVAGAPLDPATLPPPLASALERLADRFVGEQGTWFSVVPEQNPMSEWGEAWNGRLRAVDAPFERVVGGLPGTVVDMKAALLDPLPLALALLGLSMFVLLFAMFASVVVPLKAIALNTFSLSVTFGALVWVFQEGHLAGILDFTAVGSIFTPMPALLFCIAFGLSMDYEVFMLTRIKEEWDRTHDNTIAVAIGLQRTGRIVTASAVVMAVVFFALVASNIVFLKILGFGLGLAVLVDAFVIRSTLLPAFMRLLGDANWWAPARLRRVHRRIAIPHADSLESAPVAEM
ncbi:MAG: MMPL family transporter [Actinomycetota bacterium]